MTEYFCEWASLSTTELDHGLDHPVRPLQYSCLYTIQVAKKWQFRLLLAK